MVQDATRAGPAGPASSSHLEPLDGVAALLDVLDTLPREAAGVLAFGDEGRILVADRKICWAVAAGMSSLLTELLVERREPPLARHAIEQVYRRCRQEQRPLGLGLVESGLLSAADVRAAFAQHHARAVARLARGSGKPSGFHPATASRDDRCFSFSCVELLTALAPPALAADASRARAHLAELCLDEAFAVASLQEERAPLPSVLAAAGHAELSPGQVLALARWTNDTLARGAAFDASLRVSCAVWAGRNSVVTWQHDGVCYGALCTSRPASAMLISALAQRAAVSGTSGAWPVMRARSP
jgi:hypothetical protein